MIAAGRIALLALACLGLLAVPIGHAASAAAPRPHIVAKPIAFPAKRKSEMQAYAKRHYGLATWQLRNPKVIVEHITVSSTFSSAFSTFNADVADAELHELPGTCAHFVVDTDGTIYQLVPLGVMCRHTVGLNWTAIGIEHVGMTDAQVHGQRTPDGRLARVDGLADEPVPHQARRRDRPQREPHEPVSQGALRRLALPDARRLREGGHERLPRRVSQRSRSASAFRPAAPSTR